MGVESKTRMETFEFPALTRRGGSEASSLQRKIYLL
jgi:hypothetical protein